jgi:hypothetical protein
VSSSPDPNVVGIIRVAGVETQPQKVFNTLRNVCNKLISDSYEDNISGKKKSKIILQIDAKSLRLQLHILSSTG